MEAGQLTGPVPGRISGLRAFARERPAWVALAVLILIAIWLMAVYGLNLFAQRTLNGLVSGSYFALGAIGLTLVYGILKLVNFAQGDMLTFGAYIAFAFNVSLGLPLVLALLMAVVVTAALGVLLELIMFRPMRKRKAGMLQLLLMTIGLAFVLRNMIQLFAGTQPRALDVNVTDSISFAGLTLGRTELIVIIVGLVVVVAVASMLRLTSVGRQMRALADNFDLAETTGHRHRAGRDHHLDRRGRTRRTRRRHVRGRRRSPLPQHGVLPPVAALRGGRAGRNRQCLRRPRRRARNRPHPGVGDDAPP
jgi:ABC-type branched-subunit amino acid transport system permease subunit